MEHHRSLSLSLRLDSLKFYTLLFIFVGSVVFLPLVPVFLFIFTNFNTSFWETPPPGLE